MAVSHMKDSQINRSYLKNPLYGHPDPRRVVYDPAGHRPVGSPSTAAFWREKDPRH
jgi:hypothetical protein